MRKLNAISLYNQDEQPIILNIYLKQPFDREEFNYVDETLSFRLKEYNYPFFTVYNSDLHGKTEDAFHIVTINRAISDLRPFLDSIIYKTSLETLDLIDYGQHKQTFQWKDKYLLIVKLSNLHYLWIEDNTY